MCTGKCAQCIGITLYPLALISVICNIILFFPDWKTQYAKDERDGLGNRITEEVKYMGGVIGGGIMVLIPAIHIHLTGKQGCCANRCGMFLSVAFAGVGVAGALYSFIVAVLGLTNGPTCFTITGWTAPFREWENSYLNKPDSWKLCLAPENVVEFNLGLFATLLVASSLQLVLCAFQMVNGLFGCLCGTCRDKTMTV
ncbi:transmembrane 4 L6 family member 4 isoform X2 [Conger conger]|uniref:transmembrane 4 L6 family member 4 isoform X2 n=1 Tax=Conger conger TaxID=82655 RepID=UPI002A59D23D|nr:transmembrane 4 L6 family member 4 isoform X2 [Conger conger]